MDTLRLKGLEFYGRHGTEKWERDTGCRFAVEVELGMDFGKAAQSDRLQDTLDYRSVHSCVQKVLEGERHNLIERVAGRIVEELFECFPVERVTVRVAKPEARIGGLNRAVEIELSRTRGQWAEQGP